MIISTTVRRYGSVLLALRPCTAAVLKADVEANVPVARDLESLSGPFASNESLSFPGFINPNQTVVEGLSQSSSSVRPWPEVVYYWDIEIPLPPDLTKGTWYLHFRKKDGPTTTGTDYSTITRLIQDSAAMAKRLGHYKPNDKVRGFNMTDPRRPPRWNIEYAERLAETTPSWQLTQRLAGPIFEFMAQLVWEYGRNLHSCQVTVFQQFERSPFPPLPFRPRGKKQARGGFKIQFYRVDIPRPGSSGSLPSGGGSSHGGTAATL